MNSKKMRAERKHVLAKGQKMDQFMAKLVEFARRMDTMTLEMGLMASEIMYLRKQQVRPDTPLLKSDVDDWHKHVAAIHAAQKAEMEALEKELKEKSEPKAEIAASDAETIVEQIVEEGGKPNGT